LDWQGIGLTDEIASWLDHTGQTTATKERRLDPFATSMRDFDDVSADLASVAAKTTISHNDVKQRLADLRAAALIETPGDAVSLTALGKVVLNEWAKWDIANSEKADELARTLVVYGVAFRLSAPPYEQFFSYWAELRAVFAPEALIDNWDSLFTLNYLDHRLNGFAPGDAYRDEMAPVSEIEYDLDLFAKTARLTGRAVKGAEQVGRGIEGKIPRGRARATACLAMELLMRPALEREALIVRFGVPLRPREWDQFNAARTKRLLEIAASFDVTLGAAAGNQPAIAGAGPVAVVAAIVPDYANALKPPPQPNGKKAGKGGLGGRKKTDHKRRQERNSEIGKLGEEFILGYERWRLAQYPHLVEQIVHVSLDDDTLGYDIKSFETDGRDRYVEVKATEGPLVARFFLSANEAECAEANADTYVVARVGNLRTQPILCELRHPFDELDLTTSIYECTFRSKD